MRLVLVAAFFLLAGCDDDDFVGSDLTVVADLHIPRDAGPDFAGVLCTEAVCASGTQCCAEATDGSYTASCTPTGTCAGQVAVCDGPEDCSGATTCCVRFVYEPGSIMDATIMCSADCPAEVTPMMKKTKVVSRLCHDRLDCIGVSGEIFGGMVDFDGCCVRAEAPTRFCAPSSSDWMTLGKYTCN